MRYQKITSDFFRNNRDRLTSKLKPDSVAIVTSNDQMPRSGDQNFPFRQNSDLFYLTGIDQEKTILCLFPAHPLPANREILFTIRPDELMETWEGHKLTKDEITAISGITTIKYLDEFNSLLPDLVLRAENIYLGLNENMRYTTDVPYRAMRFAHQIRQDYPLHNFERLSPLITEMRLVKQPEELQVIRKACDITGQAFGRVLKNIRPGMIEYEAEAEITHEYIRNGANGHSFSPIVATGASACTLHYETNANMMNDGDLVLIDFGAEYGNYAADCSRTIPVNGTYSARQRQCYEAVLRVFRQAVKLFVPGTTIDELHKKVCRLMEQEMIGLGLFTAADLEKQDINSPLFFRYFMHGTTHFMGLDVHDVGHRQVIFKKGMVLTCEPGLYIKDEGIGIRLENDILVDDQPVDLMSHIPIEPDEIEQLMKNRL
ncbi:MAG: aminopeptidase P N-terminal domain-containing protein [Bacteroidia bacterium]|nr:aminopeptidase P N-terminal domain-containing protein [Bacteroidia bacterium]